MAAEGSGPVAAGHSRTLSIAPIRILDSFCSDSGEATPGEEGKTDLSSLREAAARGGHEGSGFHCIYPRACEIVIFVSIG